MLIAQWMLEEYSIQHHLAHTKVARDIRLLFGEAHVYPNRLSNQVINKGILEAFKSLTGNTVVWSRAFRCWRQRRPCDPTTTRTGR